MKLSLGTPSHLYWATLVTVSDLIWTMCRPCDSCSGQTSMFDPLQSSTYKSQTCCARSCMELPIHGCTINQLCGFIYSYEDKSFVEVILASETLLFDNGAGTVKLPEIVSGCVHQDGHPNPSLLEVPDLVGLGGGPLSLVNQIGSSIDDKFAYCLPPNMKSRQTAQIRMVESVIACLAIKDGEVPIFGNVVQPNMHVKYDLGKRLLSLAPAESLDAA
ncbi:aspartic proteinase CDR1-like [Nymphaea colorata]|nr:aspartic proteinase CDR1-like [Nymphaea colorata]